MLQIGGRLALILHMGAGHTNNSQRILTLFGCDKFCNNLQEKEFESECGGIKGINHSHYKQGEG